MYYYVLTKTLKCLCTLYLKNSNLQIFIHEKLCMKLLLNDEKLVQTHGVTKALCGMFSTMNSVTMNISTRGMKNL